LASNAALSRISGGNRSINFPENGFSGALPSSLQKSKYSSIESLNACSSSSTEVPWIKNYKKIISLVKDKYLE